MRNSNFANSSLAGAARWILMNGIGWIDYRKSASGGHPSNVLNRPKQGLAAALFNPSLSRIETDHMLTLFVSVQCDCHPDHTKVQRTPRRNQDRHIFIVLSSGLNCPFCFNISLRVGLSITEHDFCCTADSCCRAPICISPLILPPILPQYYLTYTFAPF